MSVTATSSSTSTSTSGVASNQAGYEAARTLKRTLGSEDFLKLLTKQMSNQDPLKPMDDTAFISQMASFSSLSTMNELSTNFTSFKTAQAAMNANSFIGRTLTVTDSSDSSKSVTGVVTGVDLSGSEPKLLIDGNSYSMSSIQKISTTSDSSSTTN